MKEKNVNVQTRDGLMDTFVAIPDGDGPFSPVIIYMDVPGIREELRHFARRIAENGFIGVLPDLYYREGTVRFDLSKGGSELKKMFAVGSKLTNEMVMADTQGLLEYLSEVPEASGAVGTIGYCMSGQFVLTAAGTFPDRIKATASLYGTRMVTDKDDSPHKLISKISGELYLGFAEQDHFVEDFVIPTLEQELEAADCEYQMLIHAGTEHGFCFPERPGYVEAAAESVWESVFSMYERKLKQ
ncbi:MAG: dienelactone hydrolase family protein [Pseudomonadales bacterium]|nr:dienelactone hydrolase family protein [Pseudomonadales bacterium]